MIRRLVIVGCGGFGREVAELVRAVNARAPTWELLGFVDDGPDPPSTALVQDIGSRVLGPVSALATMADCHVVVAIGSPVVRRRLDPCLARWRCEPATLVHPAATVGSTVHLGDGTIVCAGARLSTHIRTGRHVHIDQNATVGHDTTLGDHSRLNPLACVSGGVTIDEGALIGASATVLQGCVVGRDAVVGAGAVVLRDVPSGTVVKGVPAR
jgi:sugar O-acyltransferase (sialic acid O-acetyltransferase NeuD family)